MLMVPSLDSKWLTWRMNVCTSMSPELPQPDLASLGDIRRISTGVLRATNPTELNYSYEELKALDEVSVTVMPEKKGMVFKHVEYLVESKVWVEMRVWQVGGCRRMGVFGQGLVRVSVSIDKIRNRDWKRPRLRNTSVFHFSV